MPALPEILSANQTYAAIYHRRELPLLPRLNLAVLICMDARIDPAKILGLKDGDAHVIRNAGGRAADNTLAPAARFRQPPRCLHRWCTPPRE